MIVGVLPVMNPYRAFTDSEANLYMMTWNDYLSYQVEKVGREWYL